MRIAELLENKQVNYNDFVEQIGHKKQINYDLVNDVIYYMNNNDNVYRQHLYPSIVNCVNRIKSNKSVDSNVFSQAVNAGYKSYINEYPIRELSDELSSSTRKKICDAILDKIKTDVSDGKYN